MEELAKKDREIHNSVHSRVAANHIEMPFFAALTSYLGYAILILVGHTRDFVSNLFKHGRYRGRSNENSKDKAHTGQRPLAVLLKSWENFYTRRIYHRVQDCFNRPIGSAPGANFHVLERVSEDGSKSFSLLQESHHLWENGDKGNADAAIGSSVSNGAPINGRSAVVEAHTNGHVGNGMNGSAHTHKYNVNGGGLNLRSSYQNGKHFGGTTEYGAVTRKCLNLGSYNYLGFADDWNETCEESVISSLQDLPVSMGSSRMEFGTSKLHKKLESTVSLYLNKEAAICFNMGFNTNSTTIPALLTNISGGSDLLISDELNHTSIVNGARASGASIRTFRHNDADHLEEILKEAILMGRPRSRRPWNKILVIVEGVYSMEGEYCNLKAILGITKRYKAYLYLDEAHSIGAMGVTGRGCCEYCGVDPKDVDILMGTFTKSFGGMGGYVAASKDVIEHLKRNCAGALYHNSMSPVVCQQVIRSFEIIMYEEVGKRKLQSLRDNSNYFRMKLTQMGLQVLGNYDSPIMPVMLYNPTKIPAFSRELLKRGIAVVVVGFPAVPLLEARARFCISAGHSREDLDYALEQIEEVVQVLKLRYAETMFG
uniref:serine C-palmitoyltransferase n=1 Tax=Leptocylindrus danicus TaxID=163516 RepID=A0A7S2K1K0_9STRA